MSHNGSGINVRRIADLARLSLDESDIPKLQADMEAILDYVGLLSELDVSGVEPMAHAVPLQNVWRDDAAAAPFDRSEMLANAPSVADDTLIRMPRVLPGEEES